MMHHSKIKKFGRKKNARKAFMKGLASALIINGRIETTIARAKAIRPFVERLVSYGKDNTLLAFEEVDDNRDVPQEPLEARAFALDVALRFLEIVDVAMQSDP